MKLKRIIRILILIPLLILICSISYSDAPENLIKNGGFEEKMEGWSTYGDVKTSVETKLAGATIKDEPIEGKRALFISIAAPGDNFWSSGLQHKDHTFEKGKKYTLAAFLKMKKGTMKINFKPELQVDPWTKIAESKFDMTEEWTEFHVTSPKLNKDVVPASITFHIAFGKAEFWMDNVRFFEGDYVAPDGKPKSIQIKNKLSLKWGDIKSAQ